MDDAAAMSGEERVGELDPEVDDELRCERTLRLDHLVERAAVEQLADEKRPSVLLAGVMDRADVRMGDERCDPRFATEPLERLRLRHHLAPQELERHVSFQTQVARAVDLGRTVASDLFAHLVVRDLAWRCHCGEGVVLSRAYSPRAAARGAKFGSAVFQTANSSS